MQAPHHTATRSEESPRDASSLQVLVDLAAVLRQDEDTPRGERRRRDRSIGRELAPRSGRPDRQLAAWLAHPEAPGIGDAGRIVFRMQRLATLLLAMLGLFTGAGAAAAVFRYDGENPVNVIHVLAVFVFAQLLLVGLTALTMLPRGALLYVPGARSLQEILSLLSPGRIRGALIRRLPASVRDAVDGTLGKGIAHRALFGGVDKWAISHSAQWGALCFQLGALAGCLYLVVFSDLAFSWNTTLQVEPTQLHRLTSTLAAPWAGWLPNAEPSLDLIESTRHFRLKDGIFPGMDAGPSAGPSALGGWWPFLVACMVCYGLLPRLFTLTIAAGRLRAVTRQALLHLPGARDLLDRLNGQLVETAIELPWETPSPGDAVPAPAVPADPWPDTNALQVVDWAGAGATIEELGDWFHATIQSVHDAGGTRSLAEDQAIMSRLGSHTGPEPIAVLVRAWEPPMTEFVDFVAGLRKAAGPDRSIAVVPVGVAENRRPLPRELDMWRRRLGALGDPWLRVVAMEAS